MKLGFFAAALIAVGAHAGIALIHAGWLLLLVAAWLRRDELTVDRRLLGLVLAFGALALLHNAIGTRPTHKLDYALRWRFLLILPIVPALLDGAEREKLRNLLLALTGISGLYALHQVLASHPGLLTTLGNGDAEIKRRFGHVLVGTWWWGRPYGSGLIHNIPAFAHTTAVVILWPVSLWVVGRRRPPNWALGAGLIGLLAMASSGSRGAWIGLAGGLAAIAVLRLFWTWRRPLIVAGCFLVIAGGAAVSLGGGAALKGVSLAGRGPIWNGCTTTATEVFPRGLGYGNHPGHAAATYPQKPGLEGAMRTWCHNSALSLAAEAPSTLIPAALLLVLLIVALTAGERTDTERAFALAALLATVAIGQLHDPHFQREFFPVTLLVIALGLTRKRLLTADNRR